MFLVVGEISKGNAWRIVGCSIFASSLVAVYAASTLSHLFSDPRWRSFFRVLDQGFIYFLIVGTYTPFALAYLRTPGWLTYLGIMWAIALIGFCSKLFFQHRVDRVAVWSYIILGWMPIVPLIALIGSAPAAALWLLLAGGLCYTLGTIFLVADLQRYHFHAIWHTLVIAGSTCHYFVILVFVAYAPARHAGSERVALPVITMVLDSPRRRKSNSVLNSSGMMCARSRVQMAGHAGTAKVHANKCKPIGTSFHRYDRVPPDQSHHVLVPAYASSAYRLSSGPRL